MTFVCETDDLGREPSEPNDNDQNLEQVYTPPDESPLALPEAVEPVPLDISSNDSPSQELSDVSPPSPREAYLIRSYIQKIAAVVSLLPATSLEHGLTASRQIYVIPNPTSAPKSRAEHSTSQCY